MIEYTVKVNTNGNKYWYLNGERHREDGPAIECADGGKSWWLNGKLHREDGPAIEHANGNKAWYLNDEHHREDGPAVEYANGNKEWYLNDELLTEEEFNERMAPTVEMTMEEICKALGKNVKVKK
jgi:hypothetical protein